MFYGRSYVRPEPESQLGSFVTGCLAGMLVGGVVGLLLAPHRGDITRRKIVRKANEARDQVVEAVEDQLEGLRDPKAEAEEEKAKEEKAG